MSLFTDNNALDVKFSVNTKVVKKKFDYFTMLSSRFGTNPLYSLNFSAAAICYVSSAYIDKIEANCCAMLTLY